PFAASSSLGSSGCCNGMWILEDVVHAWFPVDVAGACADRGVVWAGGAVCPDRWGDRAGPEHGVAGGATQPDERVRAWWGGPAASAGSAAGVWGGAGRAGWVGARLGGAGVACDGPAARRSAGPSAAHGNLASPAGTAEAAVVAGCAGEVGAAVVADADRAVAAGAVPGPVGAVGVARDDLSGDLLSGSGRAASGAGPPG